MRAAITPLGGISNDQMDWQERGRWQGRDEGIDIGRQQGLADGYNQGYAEGYNRGHCIASQEAHVAGYNEAIDEANLAIQNLQAQHATYQQEVTQNYRAYETERDELRQLAAYQAAQIQELEEQLAQRDQMVPQQQAKFDTELAAYQRLKQQGEILQKDIAALTQQTNLLQGKNASLEEAIKDLAKTNHERHSKIQEQSAHYNGTLTFLNAILGAVKSTLKLNPAIEDSFRKLFSDEYKKSVEFRIQVDDIKSAPHKDSDFALLLPQTHEFILTMLENECRNELLKK